LVIGSRVLIRVQEIPGSPLCADDHRRGAGLAAQPSRRGSRCAGRTATCRPPADRPTSAYTDPSRRRVGNHGEQQRTPRSDQVRSRRPHPHESTARWPPAPDHATAINPTASARSLDRARRRCWGSQPSSPRCRGCGRGLGGHPGAPVERVGHRALGHAAALAMSRMVGRCTVSPPAHSATNRLTIDRWPAHADSARRRPGHPVMSTVRWPFGR